MSLEPAFDAFAKTYEAGHPQVVWTRLIDDLETPVSAYLKIGQGKPYAFLFESVEACVRVPVIEHAQELEQPGLADDADDRGRRVEQHPHLLVLLDRHALLPGEAEAGDLRGRDAAGLSQLAFR